MATGLFVTHPLTGEKVPVWVGNYVLMSYGEGAVMAVPAHDERDFDFAKKYGLPIKQVIAASTGETLLRSTPGRSGTPTRNTACCVNSGKYDGLDYDAGGRRHRRRPRSARTWAKSKSSSACATGAFRASATGAARSRSSIARLRRCAGAGRTDLPVVLPEDVVPDGSGNPLNKMRRLLRTAPARSAAAGAARNRHHGHLRRVVLVLRALRLPGQRPAPCSTSAPITGCRSTSTSAASSTPSCTCCMRASSTS